MSETKPHLFVATPAYGGNVNVGYMRGVIELQKICDHLGWGMRLWLSAGHSLIQRARNFYVADFLKGPNDHDLEKFGVYTHLLSIDSDITFDPRAVIAMVATEHDFVCCAYPKKTINWERVGDAARKHETNLHNYAGDFAVNHGKPQGAEFKATEGCVEILDAATGFLLTTRKAILDMCYAYPETLHIGDMPHQDKHQAKFALFDCEIEPVSRRYLSEDYVFSRRWQRMGRKVWLYLGPFCQLGHVGAHEYTGNVYTYMVPSVTAQESSLPEDATWPTADGRKYGEVMLERYHWAARKLAGARRIADACCGPGYGMPILRDATGASVVGFDRDPENLRIAVERDFGDVRMSEDVAKETLDGFDALCCLETFEHLPDPVTWLKSLSPSVTRIALSCPCIPTKHYNKHHLADYTYQEVINIVRALGWNIVDHRPQDSGCVVMVYAERGALAEMSEAAQ